MSGTVHYRGRLEPVIAIDGVEAECKLILGAKPLPTYCDNYTSFMEIEKQEEYLVTKGVLYKIIRLKEIDIDEDIFMSEINRDGTVDFEVKYYNGGCGFSEGLERALTPKEAQDGE